MIWRLLALYAVVEIAALVALASAIGWGWTLFALLAAFALGWGILAPMAGSHLIHRIERLRTGLSESRSTASDSALVGLAGVLVLVPGLVTTAAGVLLLMPPVRSAAGPRIGALAVRGLRRMPLVSYAAMLRPEFRAGYASDGRDYIDGEVIDVHDVEPRALPDDPWSAGPR